MKSNYNMDDLKLRELILSDNIGEPAHEVLERLQHNFMLKSSKYKIRQNSFTGMLSWMISSKQLMSKLIIAACFVSFFMLGPVIKRNLQINNPIDSTKTNSIEIVDTAYINQGGVLYDTLAFSLVLANSVTYSKAASSFIRAIFPDSGFTLFENNHTLIRNILLYKHLKTENSSSFLILKY